MNFLVISSDDQGRGQTGYYGHPIVKTPNLDAMSWSGVRCDRYYTPAPACSPARVGMFTGRNGIRSDVQRPFYAMRLQERTVAQALKTAGYRTAHFGKWHVGGQRGVPGAPLIPTDPRSPSLFGFDEWFGNTCNMTPQCLAGDHTGSIIEIPADSSSFIADKTNDFIDASVAAGEPFFINVAFSAPHDPFESLPASRAPFEDKGYGEEAENIYGMMVELDNAIGSIRQKLRDLGIENDTLVWFCSDNGGVDDDPHANGAFRGMKGGMYEGGIRVPAIIEWPNHIRPRVTEQVISGLDIAPTICSLAGVDASELLAPLDGIDMSPFLTSEISEYPRDIHFYYYGRAASIFDRWKIVNDETMYGVTEWELYDLHDDPLETNDLSEVLPNVVMDMAGRYYEWFESCRKSVNGLDYPEGRYIDDGLPFAPWFFNDPIYAAYVDTWKLRPEYAKNYQWSMSDPDVQSPLFDERYRM